MHAQVRELPPFSPVVPGDQHKLAAPKQRAKKGQKGQKQAKLQRCEALVVDSEWVQNNSAALAQLPPACVPQTKPRGKWSYTLHAPAGTGVVIEVLLRGEAFFL